MRSTRHADKFRAAWRALLARSLLTRPFVLAQSAQHDYACNRDPPIRRLLSIAFKLNMSKSRSRGLEYVEPIGMRVVVRKDEPKRQTKGGIALPDASEIPTITGRIVTISAQVEHDENLPLRQYDKVLFHPKNAIPVDFEPDNQLFVVPVEDIVAVFRTDAPEPARKPSREDSEEEE